MMLHHVSVGVKDVERAGAFYDAVLKTIGYKRYWQIMPYAIAYGEDGYEFWVQLPHDQKPAVPGNGPHFAFNAPTKAAVHAFHAAALANGGTDDGKPGPRPDYGPDYYGAFVRDLDGNKIEAVLTPRLAKSKPAAKPKAKTAKKPGKKTKKPKKKAKRR
jgi:catechol 2,3-dioxygenase-like lactoylglutathione lyase family enzyme